MDKSRLKNYGLWVSISALIPMIFQAFGLNILPDNYKEIISTILSILVILGIINNPTTKCRWYIDDKNKEENIEDKKYDKITEATIAREMSEGK
ncbi:hypothetical protein CPJCM30710_22520 [Clostridium polyendosporum]|uniref:Holin n=1 Tax=Clostridium polyendosporum TaxID=69208 RepID=A0A919S0A2_9CLOT|nr:phage holin [Clostridium polyendosporum]GIM29586.1 hypothetical protein CPJCM30710_22520 [Clostridium polyendosporum]